MEYVLGDGSSNGFPKLDRNTATKTFFYDNFSYKFGGKPPKYRFSDELLIPKHTYLGKNSTDIHTTIGRYVANVLLYSHLYDHLGYVDGDVDGFDNKFLGTFRDKMNELYIDKKITSTDVFEYLMGEQWYFTLAPLVNPHLSLSLLIPNEQVEKRKEELFDKFSKEIDEGDIDVGTKIEAELIDVYKQVHRNDVAMDLFKSNTKGNIHDNMKNMAILRGPMKQSDGSYVIVKDNLVGGMSKENHYLGGQALIFGAFAKGVTTQFGGAITKKLLKLFSTLKLEGAGSDCGTTRTIKVKINDANFKVYENRFVKVNNTKIKITSDKKANFINKEVDMFSPLFCKSEDVCEKCFGTTYSDLNITNAGATTCKPSNDIMNKSMKKFHEAGASLLRIEDISDYIF